MSEESKPTEQTPKTRIFIIDGREFDDTDPKMTVDEVRQYYVTYFPELSNAETVKTERDSKTHPGEKEEVYDFKKRVGTKGKTDEEKPALCWLGYCGVKKTVYGGGSPSSIKQGKCPVCGGPLERDYVSKR